MRQEGCWRRPGEAGSRTIRKEPHEISSENKALEAPVSFGYSIGITLLDSARMPINFDIDRAKNLTTLTLTGQVTLAEMVDALNSYGKSGVTLNELYDVRDLAGERITSQDVEAVVGYFKQYGGARPENSKTAVLVSEVLDYGISRMIQIFTEGEVPFKIEIFKTMEEAMAWLEGEPSKE